MPVQNASAAASSVVTVAMPFYTLPAVQSVPKVTTVSQTAVRPAETITTLSQVGRSAFNGVFNTIRLYRVFITKQTNTRLMALCPRLHRWAGTRKVKPIWILPEQETVSGSIIKQAVCKSAPRSGQITMPAPNHLVFYRPDSLPSAQPTASVHWRTYHVFRRVKRILFI